MGANTHPTTVPEQLQNNDNDEQNSNVEITVYSDNIKLCGNGGGNYEIRLRNMYNVENTVIGYIEGTHNTFSDIHIKENYRGNGYSREAIELYIRQAKKDNVNNIKTTAVLHDAVEHVLRDNGFKQYDKENRRYKKELE